MPPVGKLLYESTLSTNYATPRCDTSQTLRKLGSRMAKLPKPRKQLGNLGKQLGVNTKMLTNPSGPEWRNLDEWGCELVVSQGNLTLATSLGAK